MTEKPHHEWIGEERRIERQTELRIITTALEEGKERMDRLEQGLIENTRATNQIAADTAALVEFMTSVGNVSRTLCKVAMGVSWFVDRVITPLWKPVFLFGLGAYFAIYHSLPAWALKAMKAVFG